MYASSEMTMRSQKELAVILSKLKVFKNPKIELEQYPTDSEVAANVLWQAMLTGDIEDRTIADLGCGTGILGIGALLLGASKVYFIDKDKEALAVLEENFESFEFDKDSYEIHLSDISEFGIGVDTIIENPPFGARKKNRNADRAFLLSAFNLSERIYSFHMTESKSFLSTFAKENGYDVRSLIDFDFPIKQQQSFHKQKIKRIAVTAFFFTKNTITI